MLFTDKTGWVKPVAFVLLAGLSCVAMSAQNRPPAGSGRVLQVPVAFVEWTEPKDHAFKVHMPQEWRVAGGVHWTGPIDPAAYVQMQSPDSKMLVFAGDPDLFPRAVPNASGA